MSHRTVQLFVPYAEASAVRVRFATETSGRLAVSPLRSIEGGYAFDSCAFCLLERTA